MGVVNGRLLQGLGEDTPAITQDDPIDNSEFVEDLPVGLQEGVLRWTVSKMNCQLEAT